MERQGLYINLGTFKVWAFESRHCATRATASCAHEHSSHCLIAQLHAKEMP